MTSQHYSVITYHDDQGSLMFSEIVRSNFDYLELCTALLADLPRGAADFRVVELPKRPKGLLEEPRRLWKQRPRLAH